MVWGWGHFWVNYFLIFKFIKIDFLCFLLSTGNTVSNLIMILPPIYGAIQTYKDGLEVRYVWSFLGIAGNVSFMWFLFKQTSFFRKWAFTQLLKTVFPSQAEIECTVFYVVSLFCTAVGIGSWSFHMTLQYEMQVGLTFLQPFKMCFLFPSTWEA